jgi:hypothetical protein
MEDYSQLANEIMSEYRSRQVQLKLSEHVTLCFESLAKMVWQGNTDCLKEAVARFFASLYTANEILNSNLSTMIAHDVIVGIPPRKLFAMLNDFGYMLSDIALQDMSPKVIAATFEENGFACSPESLIAMIRESQTALSTIR